jgi:hypothetical protein
MAAKSTEMSPQDVSLVLGTLLNAAVECEEAAQRNFEQQPGFATSLYTRARALVAVAERFEMTMLDDLPNGATT